MSDTEAPRAETSPAPDPDAGVDKAIVGACKRTDYGGSCPTPHGCTKAGGCRDIP